MINLSRTHAEVRKYVRLLANFAELVPTIAFDLVSCTEWQHTTIQSVVAAGMPLSTGQEIHDEARTISWAVFDYVTRLDVNLRDNSEDDQYRPLSREQYVLAMRATVELQPDRELYLLHINTRPAERGEIAAWACSKDLDVRWLDEYHNAEPTLAEAVSDGSWLRSAISGP